MGTFRIPVVGGLLLALALAGCIAPDQGAPSTDAAALAPVEANVTRDHFEGRLLCGVGTAFGTLNPCLTAGGGQNVFAFSASPGLETLIVGLTWTPTTVAGEDLQLLVESRGFNVLEPEDEVRYGSATGKPDLIVRIDASDLRGTEWSWDNETGRLDFQVRVFPARTTPPTVVAAQAFDVHLLAFYGEAAPEGVRPFPDEAARAPE